jgi:hypothetical protein
MKLNGSATNPMMPDILPRSSGTVSFQKCATKPAMPRLKKIPNTKRTAILRVSFGAKKRRTVIKTDTIELVRMRPNLFILLTRKLLTINVTAITKLIDACIIRLSPEDEMMYIGIRDEKTKYHVKKREKSNIISRKPRFVMMIPFRSRLMVQDKHICLYVVDKFLRAKNLKGRKNYFKEL